MNFTVTKLDPLHIGAGCVDKQTKVLAEKKWHSSHPNALDLFDPFFSSVEGLNDMVVGDNVALIIVHLAILETLQASPSCWNLRWAPGPAAAGSFRNSLIEQWLRWIRMTQRAANVTGLELRLRELENLVGPCESMWHFTQHLRLLMLEICTTFLENLEHKKRRSSSLICDVHDPWGVLLEPWECWLLGMQWYFGKTKTLEPKAGRMLERYRQEKYD